MKNSKERRECQKKVWRKWIRRTERDGRKRLTKRIEKKRKNRKIAETDIADKDGQRKMGKGGRDEKQDRLGTS